MASSHLSHISLLSLPEVFFSCGQPPISSSHRGGVLQTDVEVFSQVGLHATQGHPRLPDELVMRQLVFVAHGHPARETQARREIAKDKHGGGDMSTI